MLDLNKALLDAALQIGICQSKRNPEFLRNRPLSRPVVFLYSAEDAKSYGVRIVSFSDFAAAVCHICQEAQVRAAPNKRFHSERTLLNRRTIGRSSNERQAVIQPPTSQNHHVIQIDST